MKGRVDKSMGIVTRIAEALARIKPTDPLRKRARDFETSMSVTSMKYKTSMSVGGKARVKELVGRDILLCWFVTPGRGSSPRPGVTNHTRTTKCIRGV
jgi:hypothetical protein